MRHKGKSTSHLFCLLTFSSARGWQHGNTKERHCPKKLHFMLTVRLASDASSPVTYAYATVLRKFVIQALRVGHFHYPNYHLHIIINIDTFRDRNLWSSGCQQRPENLHWRLINCWRFFSRSGSLLLCHVTAQKTWRSASEDFYDERNWFKLGMKVWFLNWAFYRYLWVFRTESTELEEIHLVLRADRKAAISWQKMMTHLLWVWET